MRRLTFFGPIMGLVLVLASAGCGGSGSTPANPYAGAYDGTSDIDGVAGTLTIDVTNSGEASGTLNVGVARGRDLVIIPPGSYPFSGTATALGGLAASGNVNQAQSFTLDGNLPLTTAHGTLILASAGHTYSVDVQQHSGSGSTTSLAFTQNTSNSHVDSPWSANATTTFQSDGSDYRLNTFDPITGFTRRFSANVPKTANAGDVITFTPSTLTTIAYNETPSGEFFPNVWRASSGTMTVVSIGPSGMEVQLTNVLMEHVTDIGSATGSFLLNGTIKN